MRLTVRDMLTAGVCRRGGRHWFRRQGLDWKDFVKNGIEIETLRATGDAQHVVDRAEAAAKRRLKT